METSESSPKNEKRPRTLFARLRAGIVRYWAILRDSGRSRLSRLGYVAAGGAGAGFCGFALLWIYLLLLIPLTPGSTSLERARRQVPSTIVTADGKLLATLQSMHREWRSLGDISPFVVDALIATEDHRFYKHGGVDGRRLLSSTVHTLTGDPQGGSTLTMQLARNLYPDRIGSARSFNRKLKEIVTAKKIERLYTKEQILETYLNTVPFLYNARGIEMAAHTYFGKDASELDLAESATLVGMLKGTSYYNPIRHPQRAQQRRNVVLMQMVRNNRLDEATYESIRDTPVEAKLHRMRRPARTANHFTNRVEMIARSWADQNGRDLESEGLTIHTTLDSRLQRLAEQAVRRQSNALQNVADVEWSQRNGEPYSRDIRDYAARARRVKPFANFWSEKRDLETSFIRESPNYARLVADGLTDSDAIARIRKNPGIIDSIRTVKTRLESGFIVVQPGTGHVLAWVGSRDYFKTPFDHVASAKRQPGSTFKPVVYAAALERGYKPDDLVRDEDVNIRVGRSDIWRLASSSDDEAGYTSLRDALANSRNNIAAALIADVGIKRTARLANKMGIDDSPLVEVPSLALGTSPTSLIEMATMYTTIASDGIRYEPVLVSSITDADGNVVAEFTGSSDRALSEESARLLTDMLRDVVDEGTARRIRYQFGIDADVAGKTGTTQNNMDGWFFLMHPDVVAGAWVGFDDPRVTFRSDFWGEGAHNALFLVGDFFRAGTRSGTISRQRRFEASQYERRRIEERDRKGEAPRTRGGSEEFNFNDWVASAYDSAVRALASLSAGAAGGWEPEYDRAHRSPDPLHDLLNGSDDLVERTAASDDNRGSERRSRRRDSATEPGSAPDHVRGRPEVRASGRDEPEWRWEWDDDDPFDDDTFAILEEKLREYEKIRREIDRKLEQLRREPETRELERVLRDAYLEERSRNPGLRRLEDRLGIAIDDESRR